MHFRIQPRAFLVLLIACAVVLLLWSQVPGSRQAAALGGKDGGAREGRLKTPSAAADYYLFIQ